MSFLERRYAKALFQASPKPEKTLKELRRLLSDIKDQHGLLPLLCGTTLSKAKRKTIIGLLVEGRKISPSVSNFLELLIDNERFSVLPLILKDFEKLFKESKGLHPVTIEIALPLEKEEEDRLLKELERLFHKKVDPHWVKKPELIGGFVVRDERYQIDGSVARDLEAFRKALKAPLG